MEIKSRKRRTPRNYFKRYMANSQRLSDSLLQDAMEIIRGVTSPTDPEITDSKIKKTADFLAEIQKNPGRSLREKKVRVAAFIEAELLLRRLLRENRIARSCQVCGNAMLPDEHQTPP